MGYVFKPDHPGYNMVNMRQLAMRYDAGEELASITTDLAENPSEATTQVRSAETTSSNVLASDLMCLSLGPINPFLTEAAAVQDYIFELSLGLVLVIDS